MTPVTTLRFERKFPLPSVSPAEIEARLRAGPARFRRAFPPREVNSLYLDDHDRSLYAAAASGRPSRLKIRVRWYGAAFGRTERPALEFKRRTGSALLKTVVPLSPFSFDPRARADGLAGSLADPRLPAAVREPAARLGWSLFGRYRRIYLLSADGLCRATVDSELEFYRPPRPGARWRRSARWRVSILELKYGVDDGAAALLAARGLPFRLGRCSKYVEGVRRTGPHAPV